MITTSERSSRATDPEQPVHVPERVRLPGIRIVPSYLTVNIGAPVEEATLKGFDATVAPALPCTTSLAFGVVVPTPAFQLPTLVEIEVPKSRHTLCGVTCAFAFDVRAMTAMIAPTTAIAIHFAFVFSELIYERDAFCTHFGVNKKLIKVFDMERNRVARRERKTAH